MVFPIAAPKEFHGKAAMRREPSESVAVHLTRRVDARRDIDERNPGTTLSAVMRY
jgi:hypothetical protein